MSKWTTEGTGVMMAILCDGEHVGEYLAVERLNELEAEVERLKEWKAHWESDVAVKKIRQLEESLRDANRLLRELVESLNDDDPQPRFETALAAAEKYLKEIGGETCPKYDTRKP